MINLSEYQWIRKTEKQLTPVDLYTASGNLLETIGNTKQRNQIHVAGFSSNFSCNSYSGSNDSAGVAYLPISGLSSGEVIFYSFEYIFEDLILKNEGTSGTVIIQGNGDTTGWSHSFHGSETLEVSGSGKILSKGTINLPSDEFVDSGFWIDLRHDNIIGGAIGIRKLKMTTKKDYPYSLSSDDIKHIDMTGGV